MEGRPTRKAGQERQKSMMINQYDSGEFESVYEKGGWPGELIYNLRPARSEYGSGDIPIVH